jgi:hypothetical protein
MDDFCHSDSPGMALQKRVREKPRETTGRRGVRSGAPSEFKEAATPIARPGANPTA